MTEGFKALMADIGATIEADGSIAMQGGGLGRQRYTDEDFRTANRLMRSIPSMHQGPAPKVTATMPAEERIKLLDRAYRAGHERVLRREYWNTRRGKGRSEAETKALEAAAGALLAEGLCPYAWAKFSFQVWRDVMKKKTVPSTRWVWSEQRIHEHAGWCFDSVGSISTFWPLESAARKELLIRVGKVRNALGFGRPTEVVVSEILPEAQWLRLVEQAEREQAASLRNEQQRILNGEWVWG